jgi:hypothetical protein
MPPRGFRVLPRIGGWWSVHLRVDLPQPEDGQRLREAMRHRGGIRLRGDDAAHGEKVGSCVGVSRQSLEEEFSEVRVVFTLHSVPYLGVHCDLLWPCRDPYE